jgi:hypothetical protein
MKLTNEQLNRIDSLFGCDGSFFTILDLDKRSFIHDYDLEDIYKGDTKTINDFFDFIEGIEEDTSLVFCPARVSDNYTIIGQSNYKAFSNRYSGLCYYIEENDEVIIDVSVITDEAVEEICLLENYPILDEHLYSEIFSEICDKAWKDWGYGEFVEQLAKKVIADIKDSDYETEEKIEYFFENYDAEKTYEFFSDMKNEYAHNWEEDSEGTDVYFDFEYLLKSIELEDINNFFGCNILSQNEKWRAEPYPWPNGDKDPLVVEKIPGVVP